MKVKRIVLATVAYTISLVTLILVLNVSAAPEEQAGGLVLSEQALFPPPDEGVTPQQEPPVIFPPGNWPWYAQPEITVDPEPPLPHRPAHICAEVVNQTAVAQPARVAFSVANFGIGLPFTPIGVEPVMVPPNGAARACVVWVPPDPGHWCIQARLIVDGHEDQISQRNIDIWEPLVPGQTHDLVFEVGNPLQAIEGPVRFDITDRLGWDVQIEPASIQNLNPGEIRQVTLHTTPPRDAVLGSGRPIVDVEAFLLSPQGLEISLGGIRKLDTPPVPLHRPKDPFFAESEIHVYPYPPRAGEPTEICVELTNISDQPRTVQAHFSWANFGIGLGFSPIEGPPPIEIPPHETRVVCTHWTPPQGGHFCVQVELDVLGEIPYQTQFSQRNLDVAEPLQPGVPHTTRFQVGNGAHPYTNPDPQVRDIRLEAEIHVPGWQVEFEPNVLLQVGPREAPRWVTMIVTPPQGRMPPDGTPVLDVRALYGEGAGARVLGGFRKLYRPPVPLHPFPDPVYAEREITVHPYPPMAGQPTEICVELRNPTSAPQDVTVHFAWAKFGIGIPFTPINGPRPVHLPPHSIVHECIWWVPPTSGHVCLQVELEIKGHETQRSQRNIDIDEPLLPGQAHTLRFPVGNPLDHTATVGLGLIPHVPEDWQLELMPRLLEDMQPGEVREVSLSVRPPLEKPLPAERMVVADVEAYAEGELIGGFRKVHRPPIPLHPFPDPPYAEREITVHPYPPRAGEPTEICVELRNPTPEPQDVTVQFSWANFGIGIPFTPINGAIPVHLPPHSIVRECIHWIPPVGGHVCLQVELAIEGYETQRSQRNIDVDEPLVPGQPDTRVIHVGNPLERQADIHLGLIPHVPSTWEISLDPDVLLGVNPGEVQEVRLTVRPPFSDPLPDDGRPIVDVEAFIDGELIGGFRKVFRPPVPVHRPRDPQYAESEIGVDPYPAIPGHPTELSVEVFNPTPTDRVVKATFSVAPFGIGLPFSTAHILPNPIHIFVPAQGAARGHVIWRPPAWEGKFCVQVVLESEGYEPVWSRRNIDVGEPLQQGEPHTLAFAVGSWPYKDPVDITLGLVNHSDGWEVDLSKDTLTGVQPGETVTVELTVKPTQDAVLGTGEPIVDVEAFVEGELLGGFRKINRPPVPIHKPHEKRYAETEIVVDPFPPQVGVPTKVGSVVQNSGTVSATVKLSFSWAHFGVGIPFTDTNMSPSSVTVNLAPGATLTPTVTWTPTLGGSQCIQVILEDVDGDYEPQRSQRNVDVVKRPPCGETKTYTFTVYNDSPVTQTLEIGMMTFNVPESWQIQVEPDGAIQLGPRAQREIKVTVLIPCNSSLAEMRAAQRMVALQQAARSVPTIDVEGYIEGELVGGIEIQFELDEHWTYLPIIIKE